MRYIIFSIIIFSLIIFESCQITQALRIGKVMSKAKVCNSDYYCTLPFEFTSGHIVIMTNINGQNKKYKFFLDTGAPTVITALLADSLKITRKRMFSKDVDSGPIQNTYCLINSVQIGSVKYKKVGAINIDLNRMVNSKCNQMPDGIIGSNVLNNGILQIDFDKKNLVLTDKIGKLSYIDKAIKIKFNTVPFTKTPIITILINDTIPVNLVFDTGFNGFITLNDYRNDSTIYKSINEKKRADAFGIGYSDISGKTDSVDLFSILRCNLTFGDTTLINVPLTYGKFKNVSSRKQGSIGNIFMKNFIVTIDWYEKYIYLFPTEKIRIPDNLNTFGINYGFVGNKLIIGTVYKNSEAYKLGILPGDTIYSINDILISSLNDSDICDYYNGKRDLNDNGKDIFIKINKGDSIVQYYLKEYKLFND